MIHLPGIELQLGVAAVITDMVLTETANKN
jgi:hypothetical protein